VSCNPLRFLLVSGLSICACLGQQIPSQPESRPPIHIKGNARSGPTGLTPAQIRTFYGFDQLLNAKDPNQPFSQPNPSLGYGQTIYIIDAYDDPNIESDLAVFSKQFGLPDCTANPCFEKKYASGVKPKADSGWAGEISLDVEWAHAIAPQAKIVLVEAASNANSDLMKAVDYAVSLGAPVVSMSYGSNESVTETAADDHFARPGVTFTASSGDSGSGVSYPAASPYVVGVGGTTIKTMNLSATYTAETAWSGSGGGQSAYEDLPAYQSNFLPTGKRRVPDVAYDADPNTGFAVYDSVRNQGQAGWLQIGGTSAGAPQWAALFAIVNSMRASQGKGVIGGSVFDVLYNPNLQSYQSNFNDITSGSNGNCGDACTAAANYDLVTGLGTPKVPALVQALVAY